MHKTLNLWVRGLAQDHPENWEAMLPDAFKLRFAKYLGTSQGQETWTYLFADKNEP